MTGIGMTSFISLSISASATTLCNSLNPYSSEVEICASDFAGDGFERGDGDLEREGEGLLPLRCGMRSLYGTSISTMVGVWSMVDAWWRADRVERQDELLEQTKTTRTVSQRREARGLAKQGKAGHTVTKGLFEESYTVF